MVGEGGTDENPEGKIILFANAGMQQTQNHFE